MPQATEKAYVTPHHTNAIDCNAATRWLTLPDDFTVSSRALHIMQCYGYLIRKDFRWLRGLPDRLQAEIRILVSDR